MRNDVLEDTEPVGHALREPMRGSDYHRVSEAICYLREHASEQPSLAAVAAHLGLSEFHFQRLFHRWAGITPKTFLKVLTLAHAKELLRTSQPVLQAAFATGLSSGSRLHDLFLSVDAVTPGEYRRGGELLQIAWGMHETSLGPGFFAVTPRGLCALYFPADADDLSADLQRLRVEWPRAVIREDREVTAGVARNVSERMRGTGREPLSLLLGGTPFQIKVWQALLAIPEGAVTSYTQVAEAVGHPQARRAVGSAIGANRISFLIPCHRVLRTTGALGGYRWGEDRKWAALAMEWAGRAE